MNNIKKIVLRIKIFCRFVVRTNFKSNEAFPTNNAEIKKDRRTGESPAVISMLRMELVRGDLSPLFNQKSFVMRTNDYRAISTPKAISAEELLNNLLLCDDLKHLRKVLQTITIENLVNEEDNHSRNEVYNFWLTVDNFFGKLEKYEALLKLGVTS